MAAGDNALVGAFGARLPDHCVAAAWPAFPHRWQGGSLAVPTWQTKLVGQIGRQQRYPAAARAKQEQGITHLVFTIDRAGRLLEGRVVASSGSSVLDAEALAMLKRAQPFPPPPPELPGEQIMLPVPISFSLR